MKKFRRHEDEGGRVTFGLGIAGMIIAAGLSFALSIGLRSGGTPAVPARTVTFSDLASFEMSIDSDGVLSGEIPSEIRTLSGERVSIAGYILPFEFAEGTDQVTIFGLLRDQAACCYGAVPPPHAWIYIELADPAGSEYVIDVPITVEGVLEVGERRDDGEFHSVYRMRADRIIVPDDLQNLSGQIQELQSSLIRRSN